MREGLEGEAEVEVEETLIGGKLLLIVGDCCTVFWVSCVRLRTQNEVTRFLKLQPPYTFEGTSDCLRYVRMR